MGVWDGEDICTAVVLLYIAGGLFRKWNIVIPPARDFNGIRENAETPISCRGPGSARKKKEVYHSSWPGRGGRILFIRTLVAKRYIVELMV